MKSKLIYFIFLSAILLVALKPHGFHRNSGQSPLGRTGAPGESSCAGCHSGGTYSGEMIFEFGDENATEYIPGETYTITFTGDYDAPRYGFSITVLDEAESPVGDFNLVNENNTSYGSLANGRQYVGHKGADATNAWTFEWTAPQNPAGSVTFYYIINAANGDGGTGGDYIETGSTSIHAAEDTETYMLTFIVEDGSGDPIPDAIITLDGDEYDAGVYVFEDLPPALYEYTVSKDGYFDENGTAEIIDSDVSITVVLAIDETQITEFGNTNLVTIYPNPASTFVHLNSNQTAMEEVVIFDLQGKLVYQETVRNNTLSLDVSTLEAAIYLIQVRTANQVSTHRLFVQPAP